MLHSSNTPKKFWSSKQEHKNVFTIEFNREAHFNALIDETWCPLAQRLEVAKEPACKMTVHIICETEQEAIDLAKYHYYRTGSDFEIINVEKYK